MHRIFPILLIVLAIGLFFAYTNPTFSGPVADAQAKIKSYDSAIEAAEKFKKRESELALELGALDPKQLERLNAFLPNNANNIQLILDLDRLADESNITLSNFSIGEQGADGSAVSLDANIPLDTDEVVDSIDITVTAEGTYLAFLTFLNGVEKSLRPLDVVGLTVTAKDTGVYTYDMTLRIYWLR